MLARQNRAILSPFVAISNRSWLIVFCNLTSLYPLVFINWLDGVGDESEAESPDTPRIEPTNGDSTRTYKDHS